MKKKNHYCGKKKKHIKNGQISKGNEQHGYLYEKMDDDQNENNHKF